MPLVVNRTISKRERRLLQVLLATFVLYAVHAYSSRGSPTSYRTVLTNDNPYLPQENSPNHRPADRDEPLVDRSVDGRSELPKYIHLDLKGAPPIADKFYESFFDSLQKLQMGVRGILMEYEDTLPLEGNLINVSSMLAEKNSRYASAVRVEYAPERLHQGRHGVDSQLGKVARDGHHSSHSNVRSFRMVAQIA